MKKIIGLSLITFFAFIIFYLKSLPQKVEILSSVSFIYSQEQVFDTVNRITSWPRWTIWNVERDSTLKNKFSAIQKSPGSFWEWNGNKLGKGKITFTQVEGPSFIKFDWEIKPGTIVRNHLEVKKEGVEVKVSWKSELDFGDKYSDRFLATYYKNMISHNTQQSLNNLKNRFMP